MSSKTAAYVGMTIGSIIGGYIPVLLGADLISFTSAFFSCLGAIAGIVITMKLSNY